MIPAMNQPIIHDFGDGSPRRATPSATPTPTTARLGNLEILADSYAPGDYDRDWFREYNMPVSSIDVVTEHLLARRTRLLFQKALADIVAVAVIAIPNPDYDANHWWRYS